MTELTTAAYDAAYIRSVLPHRAPFLMVDRLLEVVPGERVRGLKLVSASEPHMQGHFPGNPILPGVVIIEAIGQTGGFLFDRPGELGLLVGVDKARFKKTVRPGDVLELECKYVAEVGNIAKAKGVAKVDGKTVASAEITYAFTPKEDA